MFIKPVWLCSVCFLIIGFANAQEKENSFQPTFNIYGSGQIWMRYAEVNPGTTVNGKSINDFWDISVRRYRLGKKGNLMDKLSYKFLLGNNNLNTFETTNEPRLLELYITYSLNEKISITAGKNPYTGLSRYAAPSSSNSLGLDVNFASGPYLNFHDDRYRKLSIAFHGQLGKFDYRAAIAKPANRDKQSALSERSQLFYDPQSLNTSAYVKYEFLENEKAGAFTAGTYLGAKDILNLGAGFMYQTNSSRSINAVGDTLVHDGRSFAIDLYYEQKLKNNHSWTLYGAFIKHDIGPNYLRNIAVDNVVDSSSGIALNGAGTAYAANGTGNIYLFQVGYFRKFEKVKDRLSGLQGYFQIQYSDLEIIDDPFALYEAGIHYFLNGQNSKITLGFQNWAVFLKDENPTTDLRRSMINLMYQFKFN